MNTFKYYIGDPIDTYIGDPIDFRPHKSCEHCFCIDIEVNGKKHRKCCMCGTQRLAQSEITWSCYS